MEISFIIPVYNTPQAALARCFASVQALAQVSWEVLLVDDGSAAETAGFLRSYADRHPSFRYLHQQNSGVSAARNLGIRHARGRYIAFIDSDDELLAHAITRQSVERDADMVVMDMLVCNSGTVRRWDSLDHPAGNIGAADAMARLLQGNMMNSPCAKLISRSLLQSQNICFNTAMIHGEDREFIMDILLTKPVVYYEKTPAYRYDYDFSTRKNRIRRSPDVMLHNQLRLFRKDVAALAAFAYDTQQRNDLHTAIRRSMIDAMFNLAADLLTIGALTAQRKRAVRAAVTEAAGDRAAPPGGKTRLKYAVIRYRQWWLLFLLAWLREAYLALKQA